MKRKSFNTKLNLGSKNFTKLTHYKEDAGDLAKGFDRVFKSIFPIEDLNDKAPLEYISYRLEKPKFDVEECIARGLTYSSAQMYIKIGCL